MAFFDNIINIKKEVNVGLCGINDGFFSLYLYNLLNKSKKSILVVTPSLFEANNLVNILYNYTNKVLLFPMDDFLTAEAVAISPDLKTTRLETLNTLIGGGSWIVVTHLISFLRFLPTRTTYESKILILKKNYTISHDCLIKRLEELGYNRTSLCSITGEYAVRGFVLDIFPIDFSHPIRIEFFDDIIESIREFDEETQKSIKEISDVKIYSNTEFLLDNDNYVDGYNLSQKFLMKYSNTVTNICNYLGNFICFFKDLSQINASCFKLENDIFEYRTTKDKDFDNKYMFSLSDIYIENKNYYNTIDNYFPLIKKSDVINYDIKQIECFKENIDLINLRLKNWIDDGKTVIFCLKNYQIKNIIKYINILYVITDEDNIYMNKINIIEKPLTLGYIFGNYIIISEKELYNNAINKIKYKTNFKYSSKIKDVNSLTIGDYIVHNIHGIGIYNGIKTLKGKGFLKDYIELLYAGTDKIYIPVEKIDLVSKYNGKEGILPKVHKLGSVEWQKTKLRVKNSVKNIAEQLIKLYASRETISGFSFDKDDELQELFESEFTYNPTPDQLLASNQIKRDMESKIPMDRLLCGDVGYGKTEVAFRAIFKAINNSKQVMYLCPTTILSTQQYENAKERFKNYPINISLLNRFTTSKDVKRILSELNNGKIDLLFGTHRILSDDVKCKDLGLLIIDEEQRFGVVHKEKIKEYKENIDVLTLTATPIPRTLQMSLVGLRSLSLIETPPINRYPIQTYVIEENLQIIRDAIYKELSRNGQIYILLNNIKALEKLVFDISNLVPEARIISAHGKLSKLDLENRMIKFINYEYDILICTTIIETGIDIPNANTLIILDADHYGLSQLYQIRGRVGRSDRIAYAYLMYNSKKQLTETAIKRLNVIKEFTELGSGFAIATRDLSIRGAGNILGSEQAGFIDCIGIDLYLKILNNEVKKLKGESVEEESIEALPLLEIDTHIDDSYVEDDDLKIEIHKKINEIDSNERLIEVKEELEDRFGTVDEKTLIYMHEELFEKLAKKVEIDKVIQNKNSIELYFSKEMSNKIDGEKLFVSAFNISKMFRFQLKNNCLVVVLDTIKLEKHYIYYLIDLLKTIDL